MRKEAAAILLGYFTNQMELIDGILKEVHVTKPSKRVETTHLAYLLHNLYCSVEDIFQEIAKTFENKVEDLAKYHRELLKRMNLNPQNFGCTSMAELALRYTVSQTGVHCAIVRSSRFEHQQENILSVEKGPLKNEYIHDICKIFDSARNNEQWFCLN